jgi:hypothetical protein
MPDMRAKTVEFVIAALFVSLACGQTPAGQSLDRVLYFTHPDTPQDLQEIATVIRSIADIRQLFADTPARAITFRGTVDQVALVEWLVNKLDQPADRQPSAQQRQDPAMHEYRMPGSSDDVVRVFFLVHTETPQDLQEIATGIRSLTDVRRAFTYSAARALALRGTADQIAMAEWLVSELDKPTNRKALAQQSQALAKHEYLAPGSSDDVLRVLYLAPTETPRDLYEIATVIRQTGGIRHVFVSTTRRSLTLRGTSGQIALAERLIKERRIPDSREVAR